MNLPEVSGLMYEAGKVSQEILLLTSQGRHDEATSLAPQAESIKTKCAEKNIFVSFFVEYRYPMPNSPGMTLTLPPMGNWLLPRGTNENTIRVHITLVFKFVFSGHPDMIADGFRVQILNKLGDKDESDAPPAGSEEKTSQPEPEGGLISPEETRRLLKDAGLDGLFEK